MFNIVKKEIKWGGKTLTLETGKVARQATGAVVAKMGETEVLCTVVAQKKAKEGVDFFPLTVNYLEKFYAAGRIPGGYLKRESRPSDRETLTSRLIDRPIRPLFPDGFFNEVQVICTVLSYDPDCQPDIVALVGASAALAISGIPFEEAIGAARVGYKDGKYLLNPSAEELLDGSMLDLVVAGTASSVMMVESEAKELSEKIMLDAVKFGHKEFQPVIKAINEMAKKVGNEAWEFEPADNSEIEKKVAKIAEKKVADAYKLKDKQDRRAKLDEMKEEVNAALVEGEELDANTVAGAIKKLEKEVVRTQILKSKKRIDGRKGDEVRQIVGEVDFLPKAHGSALFTRGETQALVVTTLGSGQDEQMIDDLEGDRKVNFMLHYNFPPYSVGEAGFLKAPGRREIGHGKLAQRAIQAVLPSKEDFPYTIRIVSEITESNGSSSMATVCGTSMALMAAGVPTSAPVSGIAMGLIKEGKDFAVLSDIMGDEDHLGDMDFKVAGTKDGITALQMDIKISGIDEKIMKQALEQAHDGRAHILGEMNKAIKTARKDVGKTAPRITSIQIDKDKIGAVIGPGGKVIKEIIETTEAKVDIEDDGTVRVAATSAESMDAALKMINDIVAEPELNKVYDGKVVRTVDFGAFVAFLGKTEGLVHVSEIADERVENVEDHIKEGDTVKVKVIGIDRMGKVKLSMKAVDQKSGEPKADYVANDDSKEDRKPRGRKDDRGGRGRDRDDKGRGRRDDRGGRGRDRDDRGNRGRRDDRDDRGNRGNREDDDNRGNRAEPSSGGKKRRFF